MNNTKTILILLCLYLVAGEIALAQHFNPRITLLFAGDLMQHQAQIDAAACQDGSYNYNTCFAKVQNVIE